MSSGVMKRLEALERSISFSPRQVVLLVDGNSEDQSAADAILQDVLPGKYDLLIYLRCFGGDDRSLPRLLSVTHL
jgi:hypothetical protein